MSARTIQYASLDLLFSVADVDLHCCHGWRRARLLDGRRAVPEKSTARRWAASSGKHERNTKKMRRTRVRVDGGRRERTVVAGGKWLCGPGRAPRKPRGS